MAALRRAATLPFHDRISHTMIPADIDLCAGNLRARRRHRTHQRRGLRARPLRARRLQDPRGRPARARAVLRRARQGRRHRLGAHDPHRRRRRPRPAARAARRAAEPQERRHRPQAGRHRARGGAAGRLTASSFSSATSPITGRSASSASRAARSSMPRPVDLDRLLAVETDARRSRASRAARSATPISRGRPCRPDVAPRALACLTWADGTGRPKHGHQADRRRSSRAAAPDWARQRRARSPPGARSVAVLDIGIDRAEAVARDIGGIAIACDVSSAEKAEAAIAEVSAQARRSRASSSTARASPSAPRLSARTARTRSTSFAR